jgi:O-antigen ligase
MEPGSSSVLTGSLEHTRARESSPRVEILERWAGPVLVFILVGALAADQGGYFPTSWGWAAFAALWVAALWLLFGGRVELRALDISMVAALAALGAWTAFSLLWTESTTSTVLDVERILVYLAVVVTVLLLARRSALQLLAAAVLAAIMVVSAYCLSTRLFPNRLGVFDSISGYRLAEPVGYWNGLGIFVAIGVLLAIGLAARARGAAWRVMAGGCLTILLPTLYFTFSRGAWVALAIGLVGALLYDPHRQQLAAWLILLLPAPAVATLLASHSEALTHTGVPLADAVRDGHRLAWLLLLLIGLGALCAAAGILIERRFRPPRVVRLAFAGVLLIVPAITAIVLLVHYGGPSGVASRAYDSFKSTPVELKAKTPDLNKRLFSLSSNGRIDLWHVAWVDYEDHSALGSGAGTFSRHWAQGRPVTFNAQDAHGAYIESLAELGPVGLLFLVAALLIPLVAAIRARSHPLAPFLLGAYLAFILHAGVDWDLEQTGVGVAGLLCGAGLVVAGRGAETSRRLGGPIRYGSLAVVLALAGFALFGQLGNASLAASKSARDDRDWNKAATEAHRSIHLMPWSSKAWEALGFAQSASGDIGEARRSFRRAIAKDPGDWTLWFDLATVTNGADRKAALVHANQLNPRSPELKRLSSHSG